VLAALAASTGAAQQVASRTGASLHIGGLVQGQYNTTSVDSVDGDAVPGTEFVLRRARVTVDATFNDLLSVRLEPDYGVAPGVPAGVFTVRDAWVRLTFGTGVRATVGQFKRPFDLFELQPVASNLVAERTGLVRGIRACGVLLGVCSLSSISRGLLYSNRDVGIMLDGAAIPRRLQYAVALTNGQLAGVRETGDGKQLTGRLAVTALPGVVVGGNVTMKDYRHVDPDDSSAVTTRHAIGWGADMEIGREDRGPHVMAGVIGGDNWREVVGPTEVATFLTAQVIATWRVPLTQRWITAIEPVGRASWADPSERLDGNEGWLVTPGVIVHLDGRNRLHLNADVWLPKAGKTEYGFISQLNVYF
jgi:hypothetical protein